MYKKLERGGKSLFEHIAGNSSGGTEGVTKNVYKGETVTRLRFEVGTAGI
jgi:hypothetical protein